VFALLAAVAFSSQGEYPFHYAGPMSKLLAPSAKLAPVTQGLPFEIVVTKGGAIGPDAFKLAGQGWKGSAKLSFSGLKYGDGSLSGEAALSNNAATSLQGLRLDVVSATELYKGKDKNGDEIVLTRAQDFQVDPLFFGDLLAGESEGPLAFTVGNLKFQPESVQITIRGLLSGLRYLDIFEGPGGSSYSNMVFAGSKLYGEVFARELFVSEPPNEPGKFAEGDDQTTGIAVNPKTGDVYFTQVSNFNVYIISPTGAKKGSLAEAAGIEVYAQKPRFDASGRLYLAMDGGGIYVLENGKVKRQMREIAGEGIAINNYDVSADGTIWVTDGTNLRMQPQSGAGKKMADKGDWRFGNVMSPFGVRVNSAGLVFVGEEEMDEKEQWDRVSIFDTQGRIVRVFGRAAKAPLTGEGNYHPGQVEGPREIAFAPDGTAYVSCAQGMLRYQPF
jgi:hypothetical protein